MSQPDTGGVGCSSVPAGKAGTLLTKVRVLAPPLLPNFCIRLGGYAAGFYQRCMKIRRHKPDCPDTLRLVMFGLLSAVLSPCAGGNLPDEPPVYSYEIVQAYPHDPAAFTQGLVFEGGFLYEGTGGYGSSTLRRVELETGAVLQLRELSDQYFGEGITVVGDTLIQLTWTTNIGFVYALHDFELLRDFTYSYQGWGITHDGSRLIVSDGTAALRFLDPETFEELSRVSVYDRSGPVERLNELEYVKGEIYANVWQTDLIARIDPQTGAVTGWIDLTGILDTTDRDDQVDVLNGIAYDEAGNRLFVTGKLWPRLFEIELIPAG